MIPEAVTESVFGENSKRQQSSTNLLFNDEELNQASFNLLIKNRN
jgi:hypothetical protein